jgi:HPt (histidine-containing phosphotransfer) domain-containing protein
MDLALLFSQLIRIQDLDIWSGLVHVGCDRKVYADALRLFCGDLKKTVKTLSGSLEQENWKEYSATVHAVKGGLDGIGAWKLALETRELEDAARSGDYEFCRGNSAATLKKIETLDTAIKSTVLFSETEKKREQVPPEFLEKKLNELYRACSSGSSTQADALARELKTKTCGGETDTIIETICTHVENLDYHMVLQILAKQPFIRSGV